MRPGQVKGLALWVGATILAHSGCRNAVLGALQALECGWHATRPYLREWLYDGADRVAPCQVQREVATCFASLLRWVLDWWAGTELDPGRRPHGQGGGPGGPGRQCGLPRSGPARGRAPEAGRPARTLDVGPVCPAVPANLTVRVLCDRGLQSPDLWAAIRRQGWQPYLR